MSDSRQTPPDVVIRASAGTGKTFQLSNRFLGLALAGAPLDAILASTFTRKAAGEILDRVLVRLAEAAVDPKRRAELAAHLEVPDLSEEHCLDVLQTMVRQLHRLRVGTLDSFFGQIARSFCLELGLPPGWRICDETTDRRLRGEAIRALLENKSADDTLRLMHLLSKGEAKRSVTSQIFDLVGNLHQIHAEAPPEAWTALTRRKSLEPSELAAALSAVARVALPAHKSIHGARAKDVERAETAQWEAFLCGGYPKAILSGATAYYKKEIPDAVAAAYSPLIEHAKAQIIGALVNQNTATRDMLARFDEAYSALQSALREFRFDDITRRLGVSTQRRSVGQTVYRLDAHLAHLLLDEFQDTSPGQWRVLHPFADQIVGRERRSFFCVGDVKQAIYGWRGGVAEIFEAITDQLQGLQARRLNQSFRCSPPVIDVVNRVFGGLADNEALRNQQQAAQAWAARFEPHTTARVNLPGYCRLETTRLAAEGQRQSDVTLDDAAQRVAQLHAAAPDRSIGVLARKNKSVARLIWRLRRLGVPASEEGGNPLTDSPAVALVLSLLRLADHPGDTASRFHVAQSPLAASLGFPRHDDSAAALRLSKETRRRLLADGYGPTLHEWTRRLAPSCNARELGRLLQLVEMAYDYESRATVRTDDFIELVERQKVESPSTSEVRVMTVHQAKGLQFDIVVLPELDYPFVGQKPAMVVGRAGPTEPIERLCRFVKKDLRPILPQPFVEMFERYESQTVEESLCLLYVALTRAVHALHILVAPSKPNAKSLPTQPGGLIRAALADACSVDPETILFENGDPRWNQPKTGVPSGATGVSPVEIVEAPCATGVPPVQFVEAPCATGVPPVQIALARPKHKFGRSLERRGPSQLEGGPLVDLASRIRLDVSADAARRRGTVMHAWFQSIGWLEDGPPTDDALRAAARKYMTDPSSVERWIADFRAALARPEVRGVFSRANHERPGSQLRLWREKTFATRDGDALLNGSIDRLAVYYAGDRPVAAEVIDFKTDRLSSGDPAAVDARADFYRPQMNAYRRAVAAMFCLDQEKITTRLIFVEPGETKTV